MMSRRVRGLRWAVPVALLGAALAVTGCTSDEARPEPTGTIVSDVTDITDQPGSEEGYVGALGDAAVKRCERDGGDWIAAGTVTNPTDDAQSYRLYVSAMADDDTRGLVQVDVPPVDAGGTAQWNATFALPDDDMTCVLRVERFASK